MKLGDCIHINKENLKKNANLEEINYIDIKSVGEGIINEIKRIKISEAPSRAKRIVGVGDTIISTVRPRNRSFYYFKDVEENTIASTGFAVLQPIEEKIDGRYLFHYISNPSFTAYLGNNEKGAAYPAITTDVIEKKEVNLPPLPTQKKIASILSAYDDLIENNLKRIQLLEEAAQRLYKEWFVDFKFPNHVNTPINPETGLPDGWERKAFQDVTETIGGGTPSTKKNEYWESGNIRWFSPTDLSKSSSLVLLDSAKKINELGLKKSSAILLPPKTILMSSRATIGLFGIIDSECCTNQGFINIIPLSEEYRYYILFNLMNRKNELEANASGATFKELSKTNFRRMEIICPSQKTVTSFHPIIEGFLESIKNLTIQNQNLKEARDLLLPRLMNRTIEV